MEPHITPAAPLLNLVPAADRTVSQREDIRRRYQPASVRLLFVGEAPPASGRFFYERNSGLYRAFLEAFGSVLPDITDNNFLHAFESLGCYLVDLCPIPVDRLDRQARTQIRHASEPLLRQSIHELRPERIVCVMRAILPNVERAIHETGRVRPILDLPYPGRWSRHRSRFIELLRPELERLTARAQI